MICGITLKYDIEDDFNDWKRSTDLTFSTPTSIDTGEIITKKRFHIQVTTHEAEWETFNLIVKEVENTFTRKVIFHLTIKGSLHKNYYLGKNYLPFTWQQLQLQIKHLCSNLCIDASRASISGLEIGVNIHTPFEVTPFLRQNIINYKNHPFNDYKTSRDGLCLGIHCDKPKHYDIKIYDKGMQYNLPYPLMRFEKRFIKMQPLNKRKIKVLSDLQQQSKVEGLLSELLGAWKSVLIYDIDPGKFNQCHFTTWGKDPKYWEDLKVKKSNSAFYMTLGKFKKCVAENGRGWHILVKELIEKEWKALFCGSSLSSDNHISQITKTG